LKDAGLLTARQAAAELATPYSTFLAEVNRPGRIEHERDGRRIMIRRAVVEELKRKKLEPIPADVLVAARGDVVTDLQHRRRALEGIALAVCRDMAQAADAIEKTDTLTPELDKQLQDTLSRMRILLSAIDKTEDAIVEVGTAKERGVALRAMGRWGQLLEMAKDIGSYQDTSEDQAKAVRGLEADARRAGLPGFWVRYVEKGGQG